MLPDGTTPERIINNIGSLRGWRRLALFAVSYWLLARIGLYFVFQPEGIAAIWPVSGLALAALSLAKEGERYKYAASIFVANFLANIAAGNPFATGLGFAAVGTVEPLLGWRVLMGIAGPSPDLSRIRHVWGLVAAAFFANAVTAFFGAVVATLSFGAPLFLAWEFWWIVSALGIIIITPLIFSWIDRKEALTQITIPRLLEGLIILVLVLLSVLTIFGIISVDFHIAHRPYILFPLVIWMAIRFEAAETATLVFFISCFFIYLLSSSADLHPWGDMSGSAIGRLVQTEGYLITLSIVSLVVSASMRSLKKSHEYLRREKNALAENESKYRNLFANAGEGIALVSRDGILCEVNESFARLHGYRIEEMVNMDLRDLDAKESEKWIPETINRILRDKALRFEVEHYHRDGHVFPLEVSASLITVEGEEYIQCFHRDITGRREAELQQILTTETLGIINSSPPLKDMIDFIIGTIQGTMMFDAIGIRLRQGDDYPYYALKGFSHDFHLAENSLVAGNQKQGMCRDINGAVNLECTCGLVIAGRTDTSNPLFTQGGSFWTNNASTLWELRPEDDPRYRPRNRCIHDGYRSVALVPLRANQEIIGLLQINDRRENCFKLEFIEHMEGLASVIAVAITRKQAEESLIRLSVILNEMTQRLELATASGEIGVWDRNILSGELVWSERMFEIYGVSRANFHPSFENWQRFIHPDDYEAVMKANLAASKGEAEFRGEFRIVVPDGTVKWISVDSKTINHVEGAPRRVIGINQDISSRKMDDIKLKASLREKETLLKEIHHRVKNNLQIITSMLSMQTRCIGDETALAILRQSKERVRAMAAVHSMLYKSESFAEIDFGTYLEKMVRKLVHSYSLDPAAVSVSIRAEDVTFPIDIAMPCGLILNELVSNSLKHAFPDEGQGMINIELYQLGRDIKIIYEDNGVGMPEDSCLVNAGTVGLDLINLLVEQLDGSIKLERSRGTRYTIMLQGRENREEFVVDRRRSRR